jgi:hypothetical protein
MPAIADGRRSGITRDSCGIKRGELEACGAPYSSNPRGGKRAKHQVILLDTQVIGQKRSGSVASRTATNTMSAENLFQIRKLISFSRQRLPIPGLDHNQTWLTQHHCQEALFYPAHCISPARAIDRKQTMTPFSWSAQRAKRRLQLPPHCVP